MSGAFYEGLDSIDGVIIAAEYGHGRRAGVNSDYGFTVSAAKCQPSSLRQ